jgi:hypothetical protein
MATGCYNIMVSNNSIIWTNPTTSVGITVKVYSQDVTLTGNTIYNATVASGTAGIHVTDFARNVTITGNSIRGFLTGISLSGSMTGTSENLTVVGNVCDGYGGQGITVVTGTFDGVVIKGNMLKSALGSGINMANVTRWSVEGNMVRGAASDCILVNTTATDGNVTGNHVSASTSDGIRVLGPRVAVTGNTAYLNGRNGINIGAANVTVTGNQIYNNSQVIASQFGLNFQLNSHYCTCVGNSIYDSQGRQQGGVGIAGALPGDGHQQHRYREDHHDERLGNMSSSLVSGMGTPMQSNGGHCRWGHHHTTGYQILGRH